jgi:hypothetical protein
LSLCLCMLRDGGESSTLRSAGSTTGECSTYTVIWRCFGVCLFVDFLFVRQIELPHVCLFVIQIENLQIDKHVELLVLKFICKSVYCTAGFTFFPSFLALVHKKLYVDHYYTCRWFGKEPRRPLTRPQLSSFV